LNSLFGPAWSGYCPLAPPAMSSTATLSFFHEFRRFATKLSSDAAVLRQALQEPAQPMTKIERACGACWHACACSAPLLAAITVGV
jgi:hypothetical protein